jgi:hypothetical protein
MAHRVMKVNYCKLVVPSRAGQALRILNTLRDGGVNLLAFTGFPAGAGKAQIDLISADMAGVRRIARKHGWRPSATKRGFLVQGDDEVGAAARVVARLAKAGINMTAMDAVTAGKGRYGMILWVKPRDYGRAARALGAK